jgi:hypothetical protein
MLLHLARECFLMVLVLLPSLFNQEPTIDKSNSSSTIDPSSTFELLPVVAVIDPTKK